MAKKLNVGILVVLLLAIVSAGCVSSLNPLPSDGPSSTNVQPIPDSTILGGSPASSQNDDTIIITSEDSRSINSVEETEMDSRIHLAEIDYSNARIVVLLNDVSIYQTPTTDGDEHTFGPSDARAFIKDGENVLTVTAAPAYSKQNLAGAVINVIINELGSDEKELVNYSKKFSAESKEKTFQYTQKFIATSSLKMFPWDAGSPIQNNPTTFQKLAVAYQKVGDALNQKDEQTFMSLMSAKKELFTKYLGNDEYAQNAVSQDYRAIMNLEDFELQPLNLDGSKIAIYGNGKLARIETKYAETTPLYWAGKKGTDEEEQETSLTIFFYQPTPGVFVAVR